MVKFRLENVHSEESWAWVDQALQDAECWAIYEDATWQQELEAVLLLQEFCLKALNLELRVWELLES